MRTSDTIIHDEGSARGYDQQAQATNWRGPEVVFGLAYELVSPGERLLDLGIGSGLSSILFHKAGLQVYGLDGSSEVLEVCRAKNFTVELKQHDLHSLPLPYASGFFDHVVCVAVLNSFQDVDPLFAEVSRILKPQGSFAFTIEEQKAGQEESYPINPVEVAENPKEDVAVLLYRHSAEVIGRTLESSGLMPLKALDFLAFAYPAEQRNVYFKAYITRKGSSSL
jgi:ubiquinone/menaquinone biosynthesis C-methylase UbiE